MAADNKYRTPRVFISSTVKDLAEHRRVLPMERVGELLEATDEFCLAISYNPGYQSVFKDLKQSTRQRFLALEFDYPNAGLEHEIVEKESGVASVVACRSAIA